MLPFAIWDSPGWTPQHDLAGKCPPCTIASGACIGTISTDICKVLTRAILMVSLKLLRQTEEGTLPLMLAYAAAGLRNKGICL